MLHYRGKLFQGDKVRLDPANVSIDFGAPGGHRCAPRSIEGPGFSS
jgi:hypothetical protein